MKNNLLFGLRAVWLLVPLATTGVARAANTWVYGFPEHNTCGDWDMPPSELMKAELRDWMLGYLSGLATSGCYPLNILKTTSAAGAISWIDNYCKLHPLDSIGVAGDTLMRELVSRTKHSN